MTNQEMSQGSRMTAIILEAIGGMCGFMGLGYLLANTMSDEEGLVCSGLCFMGIWWAIIAAAVIVIFATAGVGYCLWLPLQVLIPVFSATLLSKRLQ